MGKWNYKNICVQIKVKENLTDQRAVDFMQSWDFTSKESKLFFATIVPTLHNEHAQRIVEFFVNYKDGILTPDKYDYAEPIRKIFDPTDISDPVGNLSWPAGELEFKKKYKFDAHIQNKYHSLVFKDDVIMKPMFELDEYLGIITFLFSKERKIDMTFLKELVNDMCAYLNTDYGVIFDQETKEVLYTFNQA